MTGKITVGTIQDTDGNTVASTYVTNGVAKAHINFDNTGTANILNSFSTSSITDITTGQTTISFSINFSDVNYVYAGAVYQTGTAVPAFAAVGTYNSAPTISSSAVPVAYEDVDAGFTDYDKNTAIFYGDLA